MGAPTAGAVVLVQFPFSDLSRAKRRPALLLADVGRGDYLLCQITSNPYGDAMAVCLADTDFREGSLFRESFARPGKLFTANESLMLGSVGVLSAEKQREIVEAITHILHAGLESEAG